MDLKEISNAQIVSHLDRLVKTERKITHEILWHIAEMENRKLYLEISAEESIYVSMIEYLIKHCKYSEASAYRRLQAARVMSQIPEISPSVEEGHLNLTQLAQVQSCLKQEKKSGKKVSLKQTKDILKSLENKNGFETQKILAIEFDQPVLQYERVRPQKDHSLRLEMSFSQEQWQIVGQARDLLSHNCPDQTWAEVFTHLAKCEIKRREGKKIKSPTLEVANDDAIAQSATGAELESVAELPRSSVASLRSLLGLGTVNAAAAMEQKALKDQGVKFYCQSLTSHKSDSGRSKNRTEKFSNDLEKRKRLYIPVKIRRELMQKAGHTCEYRHPKTGLKCRSRYKLQFDHKIALALGGKDEVENYRVLCQAHNLHEARRQGLLTQMLKGISRKNHVKRNLD